MDQSSSIKGNNETKINLGHDEEGQPDLTWFWRDDNPAFGCIEPSGLDFGEVRKSFAGPRAWYHVNVVLRHGLEATVLVGNGQHAVWLPFAVVGHILD